MDTVTPKRALIVDDSRTAREALGRVLRGHDIKVEMAESAEQALALLAVARPDVIFMDHLMPGMDGFQAVRAIKDNPATATIPIMMYTSQSGEMYVGQARALGAVGVLPKQIRPVQVSETLASLNLLSPATGQPDVVTDGEEAAADVGQSLTEVEKMMEPADWSELHRWFERMLEHHGDALRADIESSVARLLKEAANESQNSMGNTPAAQSKEPAKRFNATTALIVALALFGAAFFWMYLNSQQNWRAIYERNSELLEQAQAPGGAGGSSPVGMRATAADNDIARQLADLEWSANQYATYGASEIPLGDVRLDQIERLVTELRAIGFGGEILLDSHVGDYCYVRAQDGGFDIAPDELPVAKCDAVGLSAEDALQRSAEQSVAFANYVAAAANGNDRNIRIVVSARGNTSPVYPYPARAPESTARDWNRIASENNRVLIRLRPDAVSFAQPRDAGVR